MVPATLGEWTYERIESLCRAGQVESDRHDFKLQLSVESITKTACAFANSRGGFLIVGVRERGSHFLPEGLEPSSEVAHEFGQRLRGNPTVQFESPRVVDVPESQRKIYVFHVPLSASRPHFDEMKREFWKRTNTGCERMSLEEIRGQFLNYEQRRSLLRLLHLELLMLRAHLAEIGAVPDGRGVSMLTPDMSVLVRLVPDLYPVIGDQADLIDALFGLRTHVRVIRTKTEFFMNAAFRTSGERRQLTEQHNEFIRRKVEEALPVVDECLEILRVRFGVSRERAATASG